MACKTRHRNSNISNKKFDLLVKRIEALEAPQTRTRIRCSKCSDNYSNDCVDYCNEDLREEYNFEELEDVEPNRNNQHSGIVENKRIPELEVSSETETSKRTLHTLDFIPPDSLGRHYCGTCCQVSEKRFLKTDHTKKYHVYVCTGHPSCNGEVLASFKTETKSSPEEKSTARNGFDKIQIEAQKKYNEKVQRIINYNPKKDKRLKTAESLRASGYTETWYSISLKAFSNEKFTRIQDNIPIHGGRLKFWQVMTLIQEEGLMRADFEWCMPPYYAWGTFEDIENFFCHENIQFRFKWNK
jgi:hypothetical protein